jgi:DNA polymerase-1
MRELRIVRIKLEMEREGIRTATKKLRRDVGRFEQAAEELESRIKRSLHVTKKYESECPKGFFNIGSSTQLVEAMESAGKVDEWIYTAPTKNFPEGQPSTKIENLQKVCTDKRLILNLGMRSVLSTYLSTFIKPWIEIGETTDGYIYPTFNQVRSTDEHGNRGTKGTKTGRPSSSNPNLNNIPADVEESKNRDVLIALAEYLRKFKLNFVGLRDYLIPDEGCVFLDRDYNQQELRILAHYEDGELLESYLEDPDFDIHDFAMELIHEQMGILFPRKSIKIIGFSIVYGSGILHLSIGLDCPYSEAKKIKAAYLNAIPGIKDLNRELKKLARQDKPLRTWGGRLYYCEEPSFRKGRFTSYEYKMLNLLIQGGAADITKQAMIQVNDACSGRIVAQVYDEILICTDIAKAEKDMKAMKTAMEDIDLDVPLPTDGTWSKVSWGRMKKWRDK